ncbi:hypothetical protein KRR55_17080 [Paeniglutamicibacter sp. ABSL32-1]|uniref:hypothetical protein n=1 Tax=Paeniglutamicibacter quisquiliarum TaxID=2849498 RepID=UPI001C2D397B|nr:hypothetical protein [Paeniglutamicibacter quisquiliarum]MBV1780830.1 hypothetical protein [Paeniglutamicibacter quisquiliarum]
MELNHPYDICTALPLMPVDEDDAAALEKELSDHYFRVSPAEYFERRLWEIIKTADTAKQDVREWHDDDPGSLFSQYASLIDKDIDLENPPGNTLNATTMASIESYALMQHVIETALRLYVAAKSQKVGSSPMHALLNMRASDHLRKPIKELLREDVLETVKSTIFPPQLRAAEKPADPGEMDRHHRFLAEWLQHFARFYSDDHFGGAQGNNQLKHGAAVAPRADIEYSLLTGVAPRESLTPAEWESATPIINGPSISYMELIKVRGLEPGIRLRTDNSDPATNLAIVGVGISIIRSLWVIAGAMATPVPSLNYPFDWSPLPAEVFGKSKRPPRSVVRVLRKPVHISGAQKGAKTKGGPTPKRGRTT